MFNLLSVLVFDMYSSIACTGHKCRYSSNLGEKNSFIGLSCLHCLDSDVGRKANPSGDDLWDEISSFDRSTDLEERDNNHTTNLLLFHFLKGNLGKKWFVGEASKFCGLVNDLGYIMLKMKMLCCAILVLVLIQKKNFSGLLILTWHSLQKVTITERILLLSLIYTLLATVTKKQLLK